MSRYISILVIVMFCAGVVSAQDSAGVKMQRELNDLNSKIDDLQKKHIDNEIAMLKESYSVGLNNMNYYITIGLGLITILGVLLGIVGFKSISDVKEKYNKELSDLKSYRRKSETEFEYRKKEIEKELKENKSDLEKYKKDLQLLQAQMDIKRESNKRNYNEAVLYADKALSIFPDNLDLLMSRALCLGKSRRYAEAISTMEHIIDTGISKGKNVTLWVNYAEVCLLSKNLTKFENILRNHENEFVANRPTTTAYLKAYYHFLNGEIDKLKAEIASFISHATVKFSVERIGGNQVDEFYAEMLTHISAKKELIIGFIDYLRGAINEGDITVILDRS